MFQRTVFLICLFLIKFQLNSQNSPKGLFSVFSEQEITTDTNGVFSFSTMFSNSDSHWEIDWSETHVFLNMMKYTHPTDVNKSFELRLGKGGQVYSFKSNFGEAIPPQWRQKYDENGSIVDESTPSIDNGNILTEKGNWAPWVDEVWQLVNSDQNDKITEDGIENVKNRNVHQAGSYLNNYAHRESDHTEKPFYSPIVASYYDEENQEFTAVNWVQSEDPSYLYDGRSDCNPCHPDPFKPATLFYTKYKNLGDGIIQVDYFMTNHHETRETRFFNVPFIGIRKSSLPFSFMSNPDNTYNSLVLPDWGEGATIRNIETKGWFAVSNDQNGNGASLAFVFPENTVGYSDFRYGTALGANEIRNAHIFSSRLLASNTDYWNLQNSKSTRGRYFILVDSSVQSIANKIQDKELFTAAKTERIDFDESDSEDIFYTISRENGSYIAAEATRENSTIQIKQTPFLNSFPVFLLEAKNGEARITNDPYYFSLRPYDGTLQKIQLLGYSSNKTNINPTTLSLKNINKVNYMYPNPTSGNIYIESSEILIKNSIKLYNGLGQNLKIATSISNNKLTMDLSDLPSGIYILVINESRKIIVKN